LNPAVPTGLLFACNLTHIEDNGDDDDRAFDDLCRYGETPGDQKPVVDDAEHQNTADAADDGTDAARLGNAADRCRCDAVQFVAVAEEAMPLALRAVTMTPASDAQNADQVYANPASFPRLMPEARRRGPRLPPTANMFLPNRV
jgi:hypothetical protein